jgi:hypothetical protein
MIECFLTCHAQVIDRVNLTGQEGNSIFAYGRNCVLEVSLACLRLYILDAKLNILGLAGDDVSMLGHNMSIAARCRIRH